MPAFERTENEVGQEPAEFNPWYRSAWAECAAAWLLVGLPLILTAGLIAASGPRNRLACGDDGNIELFTWHALHDVQLSSIRTHGNLAEHLGPTYFYLLAPLYGLFGCRYVGLQLGAIAINLLSIGGVLGVARHCGGRKTMLWTALLAACYVHFMGIPWLAGVWLPWVVILPFLATVFLCGGVICGRVYCLPAAVFAASFIVQTQVGYTLPLAAAMVLSLGTLVPRLRSRLALGGPLTGSPWKALLIAAVVLAIVWTPPAIKQVRGMPGRISETVGYFAAQNAGHPWPEALKTLGCGLAAFPASLVGIDLKRQHFTAAFDGPGGHPATILLLAGLQLALLPLAWLAARRQRREFDAAICLLAAVLVPLCSFSVRRLAGGIEFHHVFWMTVLGLLNVYCIGEGLFGCLCAAHSACRPARHTKCAVYIALAAIGLVSAGNVLSALRGLPIVEGRASTRSCTIPTTCKSRVATRTDAKRFLQTAAHWLQDRGAGQYRLRIIGLHRSGVATGMILGLTKQGMPPTLDPWYARVFAPQDAPPPRRTAGVFLLCSPHHGRQFQATRRLEVVAESRYAMLLWSSDDTVGEQPGSGDRL